MNDRYAPAGSAPDYRHSFHAGNIGDVWKHLALVTWLDELASAPGALEVLDTHAAEGFYRLQGTGEWTAGIGKLWELGRTDVPAVDAFADRVATLTNGDRRSYPGSPAFILAALAPTAPSTSPDSPIPARLTFCETRPDAVAALQKVVGNRGTVIEGDGFAAIPDAPPSGGARRFTHIDPPYMQKGEWDATADAIARAAKGGGMVMAWYPVKSLTRPNAMLARLQASGTSFVAVELRVTPIELERKALAGSGVIFVRAPKTVLAAVHAATTVLGPAGATHDGRWFVRTTAFGGRA